jgi:hypothetical protein
VCHLDLWVRRYGRICRTSPPVATGIQQAMKCLWEEQRDNLAAPFGTK